MILSKDHRGFDIYFSAITNKLLRLLPSPQLFSTNDGKQCEQNFHSLVLSETASTTTTSDGSSVTRGSRKYTVVPLALDDDKVELDIGLHALIVYNKKSFLS